MYDSYAGLIFDQGGTILNTRSTHRQAWHDVMAPHDSHFDVGSGIGWKGSPNWPIAEVIITSDQSVPDPFMLADEKNVALKEVLFDTVRSLPLISASRQLRPQEWTSSMYVCCE